MVGQLNLLNTVGSAGEDTAVAVAIAAPHGVASGTLGVALVECGTSGPTLG